MFKSFPTLSINNFTIPFSALLLFWYFIEIYATSPLISISFFIQLFSFLSFFYYSQFLFFVLISLPRLSHFLFRFIVFPPRRILSSSSSLSRFSPILLYLPFVPYSLPLSLLHLSIPLCFFLFIPSSSQELLHSSSSALYSPLRPFFLLPPTTL